MAVMSLAFAEIKNQEEETREAFDPCFIVRLFG
jgi:hypothetical protein